MHKLTGAMVMSALRNAQLGVTSGPPWSLAPPIKVGGKGVEDGGVEGGQTR